MALVTPNQPIHPTLDERISVKVEGQLPAFVKQDHPTFVAFLEAYYEYMEQLGKPYEIVGNLNNYVNLDKTTTTFLEYFKKQFGEDIPQAVFANANKPFVLKHLRDFYRSKGSEKSFQFLFRLLYKEEIDFYFPGKDMLRVSDGKYVKDKILRVVDTSGSDAVFDLSGKEITGSTSGATALVETILKENIGALVVSTIFLSNVVGTFQTNETITDGTLTFTLGGMVTDYTITNAGCGYSVGDAVPVTGGGASSSGTFITIESLTTGFIKSATIVSGGSGYVVGDKLTIDNTNSFDVDGRTASLLVKTIDGSGAITSIEIENAGRGYSSIPLVSGGGTGTGLSITLLGTSVGGIKTLKIINNGFGFESNPTLDFSSLGDNEATGTGIVGSYENEFNKNFVGNDGFLSDANYIQDSFYYQLFSYVLTSGESITKWRDIVKRTTHPAGLALFGNLQLINSISTTFSITGTPARRAYTIIFHDGDIVPPVVANMKVDSCEGDIVFVFLLSEDYLVITESDSLVPNPNEDFGLLTDAVTETDDYGLTTQSTFFVAPTPCQIYEQDLGIQELRTLGGYEDYLFVNIPSTRMDEYGSSLTETVTEEIDFGELDQTTPSTTQLRLGPIRRYLERHKFQKQGGYSQNINTVNGIDKIYVINGGSSYSSVPTVAFGGGGGSGAAATAVLTSQVGTSITITNIGSGYTTVPTIAISGGGGSGATAGVLLLRTSGTKIEIFKDETTIDYIYFGGLKTGKFTNATISQYISGNESTALPPY